MTKIRPVLLWLVLSPFFGFGQTAHNSAINSDTDQPVFTVHRLTGQVDPEEKRPFERSGKGRPVSLPYPTQRQQPRQPC